MAAKIDKESKQRLMELDDKKGGKKPKKAAKKAAKRTKKDEGPPYPHPENKHCLKCEFFRKARNPFLKPVYKKDGEWLEGWPDFNHLEGWVVVVGDIPDMKADKSGSIMDDANFEWTSEFAEEHPEAGDRILYVPSMLCRPNQPYGDEVPPCRDLVRMTRPQAFRCGRNHLLKKVNMDYRVDRVIAVGWSGSLVAANNMGIDHVARKLTRNPDYKWLTMPIRGTDHMAFDPTSKERMDTVIDDWTWAMSFEDRREEFKLPYRWVVTPEQLAEWMAPLLAKPDHKKILFFDVETNGVDVFKNGFLIGLFSMYYRGAREAILIPIALPDSAALYAEHANRMVQAVLQTDEVPEEEAEVEKVDISGWPDARLGLFKSLKKIVTSHEIKKVGHNLSYDANACRACFGWKMGGIYNDTMYLHYLIDPDNNGLKGLDELLRTHLPEVPDYWDELNEYRDKHGVDNYLKVPSKILGPYAAYDTYLLDKLMRTLVRQLNESSGGSYVTGEGPAETVPRLIYAMYGRPNHLRLCTHMDWAGQKVDKSKAILVKKSLSRQLNELHGVLSKDSQVIFFEDKVLPEIAKVQKSSAAAKAIRMGQKPRINWNSLPQQRALLIGVCKLPIIKRTETGGICLDEGVIKEYAEEHDSPVCKKLLNIREMEKFVTSFLDPLILDSKSVIHDDGLVHASYRGAAISTGRLSAARPNVTAMPREGAVKHLYVSRFKGGWIVTRDYSGIEIRIMALVSRCPVLLRILNEGADVHFNTQQYFFKDKADKKNKGQRNVCKGCFFGNIYGQGDQGLYDLLKSGGVINQETGEPYTLEECHAFNTMLYEAYPGVGEWVAKAHQMGIEEQIAPSGLGFVRNLPALRSYKYSKTVKRTVDFEDIKKDPNFRRVTAAVAKDLRRAQNAPVQSTAGDLTSFAAWRIQETFENDGKDKDVILFATVHDDIWVDVRNTEDVPYALKIMEDVMDNPADWLPEVLPGFDSEWLRGAPIFGECDLGISPKDAVGAEMNGDVLEVSLTSADISYLTGKEHDKSEDDTNPKEPKYYKWPFLDVAEGLQELLDARREEKLTSL